MLFIASCNQTKYVPEGKYLLKKNVVIQSGKKLDKEDVNGIIRQQPNYKRFGIKWKLMAYNLVDSTKVAEKRLRKNEKLRWINKERQEREARINEKRKEKAIAKGKSYYTEKIIPLKDTVQPRRFFREWYKYKIGQPPVVFDSLLYEKSLEQLQTFLRTKGFYYGEVTGFVDFHKNQKCVVTYHIESGDQYRVDSVYAISDNPVVMEKYDVYLSNYEEHPLIGEPFDSDVLDDFRYEVAKFMRNESLYGFSSNHITFLADTNRQTMKVNLGIQFGDRLIKKVETGDSLIRVKHDETYVYNVYFHLADTLNYEGNFSEAVKKQGLPILNGQFLTTLDTTYYSKLKKRNSDELDVSRMAIFTHNGKLFVKERVLESQNHLEMDQKYADMHLENTYLSLLRLDVFEAVRTEVKEQEASNCVDAHYYLVPKKKQSFSFEPRATNSNGFLGVAATVNYVNRNLFRGAEKLTISLSGGFESQPPVFESLEGEKVKIENRTFNTIELGPSVSLELPGLFPIAYTAMSKRLRPKTVVSTAYNFQDREQDFVRHTFQMNYLWRFFVKKTMIFQSGFPGISVVKFVTFEPKGDFESKLIQLNDLFLINAYSNQFIWQDWKFTFEYNIKEKENRKGNSQFYLRSTFDPAGNIFSLFKNFQDTLENGQYGVNGLAYAQFMRLDNTLVLAKPLKKEKSLNFKLEAGAGLPYGNTQTSLPYDYSFFGGGANDNRGWRARSLGPGAYKYYLDTNRTATQIGDIRLGASAEFRFSFNKLFKGALFADAGNVWTMYNDDKRQGGQISSSWYEEIALASGVGLRLDLQYFIIRLDLGVPIYNPALPKSARWIFNSREAYYAEGLAVFGPDYKEYLPSPFLPKVHFGIGYPF